MVAFFRYLNVLAVLALAGCTSIPVSSMYQLSKVEFMTTDLARLRIAVLLPLAIKPRDNGIVMDIKYQSGEAPEKAEHLILQPAFTPADQVGLPSGTPQLTHVYAYRLSSADVARLETIRNDAKSAKAEKKKGSLTMGISAREFCKAGPLPPGPVYSTTYVATSEIGGYIVLTKDVDLRSDTTTKASLENMPDCSGQ